MPQNDTSTGFSPTASVLTVIIMPTLLHTDIFYLPNTDSYTCLAVDGISR
jgi:hypothetical protein